MSSAARKKVKSFVRSIEAQEITYVWENSCNDEEHGRIHRGNSLMGTKAVIGRVKSFSKRLPALRLMAQDYVAHTGADPARVQWRRDNPKGNSYTFKTIT